MNLARWKRSTVEVRRPGCATSMETCPHGDEAVTIQPLDTRGRPKPGGTVCARLSELEPIS